MIISFTIPGIPQQQGSKRYVGNGRSIEANKNLGPWREVAISRALQAKPEGRGPTFTGPVLVTAVFYFPRPKGHYGSGRNAHKLRPSAPYWHASAPDLDKLCRATGDILSQSGILQDDRLIVIWSALSQYGDPRVEVEVEALPEQPEQVPA